MREMEKSYAERIQSMRADRKTCAYLMKGMRKTEKTNLCIPNKIYEEWFFSCDFLIKPVREQVLVSKKGFQGRLCQK